MASLIKSVKLPVDDNRSSIQVVKLTTTEKIANTASTTAATEEKVVRIIADADCHILVGSSPTADASDVFLPQGVVEYIRLAENDKINVFGANLYVTDCE